MGSYPVVSLKEARKKKDALKVEVENGNEPWLNARQKKLNGTG